VAAGGSHAAHPHAAAAAHAKSLLFR
jgi:hypothetical protein